MAAFCAIQGAKLQLNERKRMHESVATYGAKAVPGVCSPQQWKRRSILVSSHNPMAEIQLGMPSADQFYARDLDHTQGGGSIDVLGLGQAMIDFGAAVDDGWLDDLQVEKGCRKLINLEERASILERLDGESYHVTAGGSLSNTLMALARLGAAAEMHGSPPLRVGMSGLIGSDPLGSFYTAQMRSAGVHVVSPPTRDANTGTVVVLTSPDAQRTMLSYLGTPAPVPLNPMLEDAISRSALLVIEGYLWELPGAGDTIRGAIAAAQRHGTIVAMTAGDSGVVQRHGSEMWEAIDAGIDLLFTNSDEAVALVACAPEGATPLLDATNSSTSNKSAAPWSAEDAALALGPHCSLVCVTDGSNGSVLTALGQLHIVPPHWTETPPVDTCGAGDAYAAGLLYGFLRKFDINSMGRVGARAASAVIARHGATMGEDAAAAVAASLPAGAQSMAKVFPPSSNGVAAVDAA